MPQISIGAEPIFKIAGLSITNSYLTAILVIFLFFILSWHYNKQSKLPKKSQFYYLVNFILKSAYSMFQSILGGETDFFFPMIGGFFFYILIQNWFGLLPGVGSLILKLKEHGNIVNVPILRGNNADLNTTLSLALITVGASQYYGIKYLGISEYIKKYYRLSDPISLFTGTLEIISEFSRVLSYAFRLFGNIFAGEVLLTIVAFLIPILVSFPFLVLELFVGFIQALVFTMLSAVFLNIAINKQH